MNPFDKLFDFNSDGELDSFERVTQYQFLDESRKSNQPDNSDLCNWQDEDDE